MKQISLHVFNPWHDMALANPRANYQPPASAVQMAADLALLPRWFAQEGDVILNLGDSSLYAVGKSSEIQTSSEEWIPKPWGWDLVIYRILQKRFPRLPLPSANQLDEIRRLSSRCLAIEILGKLQKCSPEDFVGESFLCQNLTQIQEGIGKYHHVLMKQLWSSSGKGLKSIHGKLDFPLQNWCQKSIRMQGGVVLEPFYDRVLDFAMEFESRSGKVTFSGYSLFLTSDAGMYAGNILDSTDHLETEILMNLGAENSSILRNLKFQIADLLTDKIAHSYEGPLGVDMMLVRTSNNQIKIHPCVEINLRFNMGHLALILSEKLLGMGQRGLFKIDYFHTSEELQEFHRKQSAVKGYLALTPVNENTHYLAYVKMI